MKKQNQISQHVIGIPVNSAAYPIDKSPRGLQSDHEEANPDSTTWANYHVPQSPYASPILKQCKLDSVIGRMNKLGEKVDNFAHGIRDHVKIGSKLTETVKGKLSLGARIIQLGGVEKMFKQNFSVREGEKLLKASQCYLSTTAGPIAGLLFISTDKVAFCSERSIKHSSPNGELLRIHYKVLIPLKKIQRANESENVKNPSSKYIEIVTKDDFDFWFMGFLNYQKSFKYLQQALSSFVNYNSVKSDPNKNCS